MRVPHQSGQQTVKREAGIRTSCSSSSSDDSESDQPQKQSPPGMAQGVAGGGNAIQYSTLDQ